MTIKKVSRQEIQHVIHKYHPSNIHAHTHDFQQALYVHHQQEKYQ